MLLTITAVSPEVEDFAIELLIESDSTFEDLHHLTAGTYNMDVAAIDAERDARNAYLNAVTL